MACGIYSILNKQNGKIYVGQSLDISSRLAHHKWELKNNKHINSHLQSSFNKYGVDAFEFNVLEHCSPESLNDNEVWWINYFDSTSQDKGYNFESGGNSQYQVNDETRKKLSDVNSGKNNPFYGKHHSDESRRKISKSKQGLTFSKDYRDKLSKDRNTSGFFRVYKEIDSSFKQGFTWRYQYRDENDKIKRFSSVDLDKLKEKVIAHGLEWREL